jgi:hypothetical protein
MTVPAEDTERRRIEAHRAIDEVEAALVDLRAALQKFRAATSERGPDARD